MIGASNNRYTIFFLALAMNLFIASCVNHKGGEHVHVVNGLSQRILVIHFKSKDDDLGVNLRAFMEFSAKYFWHYALLVPLGFGRWQQPCYRVFFTYFVYVVSILGFFFFSYGLVSSNLSFLVYQLLLTIPFLSTITSFIC